MTDACRCEQCQPTHRLGEGVAREPLRLVYLTPADLAILDAPAGHPRPPVGGEVMAELTTVTVHLLTERQLREIRARALRDAADALYGDDGPDQLLSTATWLRERAGRIEDGADE